LPLRVGEAAGGSLTADEYKFATTGPWAIVVCLFLSGSLCLFICSQIPLVWERFQSDSDNDYEAAVARYPESLEEYKKKLDTWEKAKQSGNKKSRRPRQPKAPFKRMQPDEPRNFLRFAAALKILVGSSITFEGLDRAKELLRDYLLGFLKVHFSDHLPCFFGLT
jgi:hypothetical protein